MADELINADSEVEDLFSSYEPTGLGDEGNSDAGQGTQPAPTPSTQTTQTPTVPATAPAAPGTGAAAKPTTTAEPLPVVQSTSLTPQQISELAAQAAKGVIDASKPAPVAAEPTQEDIDKMYAVVRPTEDQLGQIFRGGAEGVKAFTEALHGAANMGANIAATHAVKEINRLHAWAKDQFAQLSQSVAPAREVAQRQEMEQHTNAFFQTFPHWTKDDQPLLKGVYDMLEKSGFKGTPEEVYARVNEEGVKLKRYVLPDFGATPGQGSGAGGTPATATTNPRPKPALPPSRMTPTPQGGTGGTSGGSGSSTDKTGPEAVFG